MCPPPALRVQSVLTNLLYVAGSLQQVIDASVLHSFVFEVVWDPASSPLADMQLSVTEGVAVDRVGNPCLASASFVTLGA